MHFSLITVQHPAESRLEISSFFERPSEKKLARRNKEKPAVRLRWRVFPVRIQYNWKRIGWIFCCCLSGQEEAREHTFPVKGGTGCTPISFGTPLVPSLPFLSRINKDREKTPATRTGRRETPLKINRNSRACQKKAPLPTRVRRHNRPDI